MSAIAAFLVMPVISFYLKMPDAAIGILATCSKIISLVIMSIAWNGEYHKGFNITKFTFVLSGWVLFAGSVSGFLSAFSSIIIRSMLSKCVTKAELGKIFSLLASLEAAGEISPDNIKILSLYFSVPLFAAPLFTYVYTQTINSWTGKSEIQFKVSNHFSLSTLFPPGAVFIVQAGIFVIACMGFAFIYLMLKRNGNMDFSELVNEEEENDSLRDALREENTEHHQ